MIIQGLFFTLVSGVFFLSGTPVWAQTEQLTDRLEFSERSYMRGRGDSRTCGIYAAAAAIKAIGGSVDVQQLLQREFVSTRSGSSVSDLIRLIEDAGFKAYPIERINGSTLYFSRWPIIIHLDGSRRVEGTHHWVTFLGMEQNRLLIFDPPFSPQTFEFGDIMAYSSGVGIVVAPPPAGFSINATYWPDKVELSLWVGLIVATVTCACVLLRRRRWHHRLSFQLGTLMIVSLLVVAFQQALPWSSLLADPVSMGHYIERHSGLNVAEMESIETVSRDTLMKWQSEDAVTIVDSRLPQAFELGHVPSATNWPIDASASEVRAALEQIDGKRPIVVYCENEHCSWGHAVAMRMIRRGYQSVFVYEGGWREWQSADKSDSPVQSDEGAH
ncbi:MAG TPA: rhodanese-like domain-containing protein [Pirellulaceae bacterium]|nr:rhodanese-like domain-containing protein [Pirellulaceae bacterium]HMO94281.1 rhodanese-like domain-containing protein [Pirellulaceae bacterium]HMP70817.1 rhodanese-like domain-containing protein [Pirellulaceae bacterium]